MTRIHAVPSRNAAATLLAAVALAASPTRHGAPGAPATLSAKLSEWKVELSEATIPAGPVTFTITNTGSIPHAFEVEGEGIEQETKLIQPGANATLTLTLNPGTYDVYCPVGDDSHKKLGMETRLEVTGSKAQAIRVTGGGPVIQILPGPFPFPDSAAPILQAFGAEREGLESQVKNGPYSKNVAPISGRFTFTAWDKGAIRDSVDGVAEFATQDGAHWRLVLDRVQTRDVPHHPRFGGVILGLYYHGSTGVHTPLVPTINSAVALCTRTAPSSRTTPWCTSCCCRARGGMVISRSSAGTAPRTRLRSCSCKSSPDRATRSSTRRAGSCSSTGKSRAALRTRSRS